VYILITFFSTNFIGSMQLGRYSALLSILQFPLVLFLLASPIIPFSRFGGVLPSVLFFSGFIILQRISFLLRRTIPYLFHVCFPFLACLSTPVGSLLKLAFFHMPWWLRFLLFPCCWRPGMISCPGFKSLKLSVVPFLSPPLRYSLNAVLRPASTSVILVEGIGL